MTQDKHDQARREGWDVFYTGQQDTRHNLYELQRVDEVEIFADDTLAILHVASLAHNDSSSLHADAIRFLAKNSPNEIDSMIRDVYGSNQTDDLLKKLNIQL